MARWRLAAFLNSLDFLCVFAKTNFSNLYFEIEIRKPGQYDKDGVLHRKLNIVYECYYYKLNLNLEHNLHRNAKTVLTNYQYFSLFKIYVSSVFSQ